MSAILAFFTENFIGKILTTFFVSMVPVIELRGAIPIGVGLGLPEWLAVLISIVGNILPAPFIVLFIKRIFAWMRKVSKKLDGLVTRLENRANKKKAKIENGVFWGLFFFVAIPLPGTGAWTGALIAAMMDMPLKKAFPAIALGVLGAAVIITVVTMLGFNILT